LLKHTGIFALKKLKSFLLFLVQLIVFCYFCSPDGNFVVYTSWSDYRKYFSMNN